MKQDQERALIDRFQCPGCMLGINTGDCHQYKLGSHSQCSSHYPGTFLSGAGKIVLGMPRGFNRTGPKLDVNAWTPSATAVMRTWKLSGVTLEARKFVRGDEWDHLNVPIARAVWRDQHVVLTWSPRVNHLCLAMLTTNGDLLCPDDVPWLSDGSLDPEGPSEPREVSFGNNEKLDVRFWVRGDRPKYAMKPDAGRPVGAHAIWAMEHEGVLFVRACLPDVAATWVDVVPGGDLKSIAPQAIDVGKFYEEID